MMLKRLLFLFIGTSFIISACSKSGSSTRNDHASNKDSTRSKKTTMPGESYTNSQYNVSLQVPKDWILLEEPNLKIGTFAINLFKKGTKATNDTPLGIHEKAEHSYIAIWPYGFSTELPYSQYATFDEVKDTPEFQFSIDKEKSKVLLLKNGTPWAYSIVPKNPPQNWKPYGSIFAQIRTTNNSTTCYDKETGNEISLKKCDFLEGDRYVREADVDQQDAEMMHKILEHLSLKDIKEQPSASDLIKIEKPLPNMDVQSPLKVKGKARGSWYFEGSFLVELFDAYGNKLAEEHVRAQGEWMTDDFVPFSVTLKFEAPDDQRGKLVFHKANPSGKPENEMHYSLPVIFPPK